jgi:hypothetical protein
MPSTLVRCTRMLKDDWTCMRSEPRCLVPVIANEVRGCAGCHPGAGGGLSEPRLYQLIRQPGPVIERSFEIVFLDLGVQAYSFTFG